MKPREEGGVVDARLNIYGKLCHMDLETEVDYVVRHTSGTQNLKCVDLSICPVCSLSFARRFCSTHLEQDNLGTNTYSSALLVGEKGADLLCEELGEYLQSD